MLISFSFKLLCLGLGTWAVFYRKPKCILPRLNVYRGIVCILLILLGLTFWLFYSARLIEENRLIKFKDIVTYADSYLDSLLVLHYLALLIIQLRKNHTVYMIKVLRSPDGESHSFPIGEMSIQQAASKVLDRYYSNFSIYNPYMEQLPTKDKKEAKESNYKFYEVDAFGNLQDKDSRVSSPIYGSRTYGGGRKDSLTQGGGGHNELFYEEYEYERRLKKRRARLITATEDAFSHLKRVNNENMKGPKSPMDSQEAAQSIFPSIVRPLQKYLRITRQQPRHTMESIISHLSTIIHHDMSPKSFLEKYLVTSPVLQNDHERLKLQDWSVVSEIMVSRGLKPGLTFLLRQGEVTLLCEVFNLPHYRLSEANAAQNGFLLERRYSE